MITTPSEQHQPLRDQINYHIYRYRILDDRVISDMEILLGTAV